MNADRFTVKTQEAVQAAVSLAAQHRNPQALPDAPARRAARPGGRPRPPACCASSASTPQAVRADVGARDRRAADARRRAARRRRPSSELVQALQQAEAAMRDLGRRVRLVRAPAARARRPGRRRPARILREHGADPESLRTAVVEVRGPHRVTDQNPEENFQALEKLRRRPHRARRGRASSTRSSAATRRSAASSRCSAAAPRTTRS